MLNSTQKMENSTQEPSTEEEKPINITKDITQTPKKSLKLKFRPQLQLDLPSEGVFYDYHEEDPDEGSTYYPASLFYKLYKKREKLGEGTSGIVRRFEKRCNKQSSAVKITRTRDEEIFD